MEVVKMKLNKPAKAALLAVTGASLFAASTTFARTLDARSLREVDSVWVDANVCTTGIKEQLRERGFFVSGSPRTADAILTVDVYDRESRLRDSARYKATLENGDADVLFSASGTETARSMGGLCDNIGDSIAGSMDEMS
jgi:hypothetical protein